MPHTAALDTDYVGPAMLAVCAWRGIEPNSATAVISTIRGGTSVLRRYPIHHLMTRVPSKDGLQAQNHPEQSHLWVHTCTVEQVIGIIKKGLVFVNASIAARRRRLTSAV